MQTLNINEQELKKLIEERNKTQPIPPKDKEIALNVPLLKELFGLTPPTPKNPK